MLRNTYFILLYLYMKMMIQLFCKSNIYFISFFSRYICFIMIKKVACHLFNSLTCISVLLICIFYNID